MDTYELSCAVEALLFTQAVPMDFAAIRTALRRAMPEAETSEADAPEGPEAAAGDEAASSSQSAFDGASAPDGAEEGGSLDAGKALAGRVLAADEERDVPAAADEAAEGAAASGREGASRQPVDAGVAALAAELAGDDLKGEDDALGAELAAEEAGPAEPAAAAAAAESAVGADGEDSDDSAAADERAAVLQAVDASDEASDEASDDASEDNLGAEVAGSSDDVAQAESLAEGDGPPFALTSPVAKEPKTRSFATQLRQAIEMLRERWRDPAKRRGFLLVDVADGLAFRSNPRYGELLRAVRQPKPQRLSRPALETLAIAAYRQPVTKPEIDQLRGVDSGGSLKVLLERRMLTVVGKKEEPGRPLLYGTTPDFLSFFNLPSVANLPSLREFHELSEDDAAAMPTGGLAGLAELARVDPSFRVDEAIATDELEEAVAALQRTQGTTRAALLAQGVRLADDEGAEAPDATARPAAGAEGAPTHH